jgi:hypothetical protein
MVGNTLFKKEDIQQAAASLVSFQNVAGETFTRALKLSADLAVRLGTDVPSAADMLGKALESPPLRKQLQSVAIISCLNFKRNI